MSNFRSPFGNRIVEFLDYRKACNFKSEESSRQLGQFDSWVLEHHPDQEILTRELVHEWIGCSDLSCRDTSQRVRAIRQFGKYLCATGENAYIVSEKYAPMRKQFMPYLFSDKELSALFSEIDLLPGTKKEPFLNEMAPTLFRLIYTCGLRPNEGRNLLRQNVDLGTGVILITHTKKNKERLVVMSTEMLTQAKKYDRQRVLFAGDNPYFFPSSAGGSMTSDTIQAAFNKAWSKVEIGEEKPRRVRVYDLRHRFASARLDLWLDSGENLLAMLPFLREYMGHSQLKETAYYIHILPENIVKSSAIDWDKFNAMFPEVAE